MSGPPFEVVVAAQAARDIAKILDRSEADFGEEAAQRYDALISQALVDIGTDPQRSGVTTHPGLRSKGIHVYHLSFSRDRVAGPKVKAPRHFLLYRIKQQVVEVSRVLHDRRDLARHIPK
jgi:toxin ParE1/3/4